MAFKTPLIFKRTLSLLSAFVLFGTTAVMAQAATAAAAPAAANPDVWTGVIYYTLLIVVAGFVIGIVGKILNIYDLSQKIQGKKGFNWNTIMGFCCGIFLIIGFAGAYWSLTEQGSMTLPEAASVHGVATDNMFTVTAIITLIVFVLTQFLLFGFLFYYRASDKRKAYYLPHNNTIEKVWTIVPAIVLTVLVVFGFFTWQRIENSTEVKGDLNIDVTGHQFAWELRYPGKDGVLGALDFHLYSGNNILGINYKDRYSTDDLKADTMVIPVHKSIRLNIHAQDVIHSVYMPHFRLQQNAVPGLPTYFKFEATITTAEMKRKTENPKFEYLLYCNKICGSAHYNMQKVVRVVSEAEYQEWIARQKPYLTDQSKKDLKFADTKPSLSKPSASNRLASNN